MELVVDRPETTLLSVGHRPELEAFHSRKIELERRSDGAKLVRDVDLRTEPALRTLWRWMRRSRTGKGARTSAP
jgi:putative ATP-binding cassette transporter